MRRSVIATFDVFAREPVLRRAKDGTLLCAFLTCGKDEPANDNVVALSRSCDNGVTWSKPETVFSHTKRGCWITEIFTECDEPFAFVHTYNQYNHYRELHTHISYLDEKGERFTEPKTLPGTAGGCSIRQGFRMSNGELLFPLYWQEARLGFDWGINAAGVSPYWSVENWIFACGAAVSSDEGKSFIRYGYLTSECELWEPNAVEMEPGHILMYMRAGKTAHLYLSESFDYGRNWTKPTPTAILNADTKVTLVKINGTVLLINNFNDKGGFENRTHLCIYKSRDGKDFEKVVEIENENEPWFYPHAYVDYAQKELYVAYENTKEHRLAVYSFAELGV